MTDFLSDLGALIGHLAYPTGAWKEFLSGLGDVATLLALIGAAVFAASYRIFFNYKLTAAGRALARFTLALTAVLGLVLLARIFGQEYAFRFPLRDAVYIWCAFSVFRLVIALWSNWRTGAPRLLDIEPKPRKKETTHG